MSQPVRYPSASGRDVGGALSVPAGDAKAPALVLIQEWWGLNDHMRAYADRFAAEGFLTLAVDLYDGAVAADADEASHRMNHLDWPGALDHLAGAIAYLGAHPRSTGAVGVTGFCMGGALTLAAACSLPGIRAAAPFYGLPGSFDAAKVEAPILMHVANRDGWVTPAKAEALAASLRAAGKQVSLHFYEADHAFMNMARPEVYDAGCAAEAWALTTAFLHDKLGR